MNSKHLGRAFAATLAGAALAIALPMAASAHVTIDPGNAEPGSYTVLTVKVPNESATASTNRVELSIPAETPFASVRYVPVPGWTAELGYEEFAEPVMIGDREITRAVTTVTWSAQPGYEIAEGQLQLFELSVGPVPDTGSIVLAAEQTYTDGEVVSWSEQGEDAEHPAPVLYVGDAPTGHDSHNPMAEVSGGDVQGRDGDAQAASDTHTAGDDVIARVLAIGGLVLGTVAVVLAVAAQRKARG